MSRDTLILLSLQWAVGFWLMARMPAPAVSDGAALCEPPTVSVLIPARNEARSLPILLGSLRAQRRPASEVIVVDDDSDDATASLAAAGGATVISAPVLAPEWAGKPSACAAGAAAARGEVLVFLDADVSLGPDALRALVDEWRRRGGLVSVQPYHVTASPYERLSAFCNLVTMMGTLAFTGAPRRAVALAFGPCLVTSRADYEAVGGHGNPSVRGQVVEDIALARSYRSAGLGVSVLAGRGQVCFRMYPEGLGQLVDGWTRALALGARSASPVALIGPFLWIWGAILASVEGFDALLGGSHRIVAGLVYAAWAGQIAWMLRRIGRFGATTAALFPVALAGFVVLFVRSVVIAAAGRPLRWRGRLVGGR